MHPAGKIRRFSSALPIKGNFRTETMENMKKRILALAVLLLFCFGSAFAESALTVGDKGSDVLVMKQRLQALGFIEKGSLNRSFTEKTAASLLAFQQVNSLPETGVLDEATRELLFSDAALRKPYPTLPPLATPAPPADTDAWPERDAEGYLAGEGEFFLEDDEAGRWIYLGKDLQVLITRMEDPAIPLVWFETEIRMRNGEAFRTVQTNPAHPGRNYQYPYVIARQEQFVLGFSDDFFGTRISNKETVGIIIRNGEIISRTTNKKTGHHLPNLDMMALYADGTAEVYHCNEMTAEQLLEKGAVDVFSFGPILIRDGEINELLYTYYRSIEPRHALGYIEPGRWLLISFQGRTSESKGTMLQRVAETMQQRGVKQALNLDGGNTMALVFRGRMLNKLAVYKKKAFVRTVTSLIGIGFTASQAE